MSDPRVPEDRPAKAAQQFLAQQPTWMDEVQAATVKDTRARLAYLIRAELVCCHIYEKVAGPLDEVRPVDRFIEHKAVTDWDERQKAARADGTWHDICYYGEWAARLCETGDLPQGELFYGPWNPAWGEPCEANRPKGVPDGSAG